MPEGVDILLKIEEISLRLLGAICWMTEHWITNMKEEFELDEDENDFRPHERWKTSYRRMKDDIFEKDWWSASTSKMTCNGDSDDF